MGSRFGGGTTRAGPRRRTGCLTGALAVLAVGAAARAHDDGPARPRGRGADEVARITAPDEPAGVLDFRIVDGAGRPIPGRLTFVRGDGTEPELFPTVDARPDDLAVRRNVVYSLAGAGRITVPVGAYTVYASRGIEWSVASRDVTVATDETVAWTARLEHEVDTTGWISGDFHLHTLTYSGHGDSNMPERIISIVGEGVEFAVATDHNHHTDYASTIDHLGAADALTAVVGNEVSAPIGHFNAFPLDPAAPPVDAGIGDANELFRLLRGHRNPAGIVPVVQVNHPRWDGIDYFRIAEVDPVTGTTWSPRYSNDFDTLEVLNENVGWGYYEPFVDGVHTGGNLHSVVRDWFNLLNLGGRYAAVGNSDSHTVHSVFAGYPRNYVRSSTDDPAAIDVVEVARRLRERTVFTTCGPFVEFAVNGVETGGQTVARDGVVTLDVRVQAASWIDCDRVLVVMNGDVVDEIPVPQVRLPVRLETTRAMSVPHDAWIALLVEGDDSLAPIVADHGRPVRPIAVVNPVWVDAEGDGIWTSPWRQAGRTVERCATHAEARRALERATGPLARGLLIGAAAERERPFAPALVRAGLTDADRTVRLWAVRASAYVADPSITDDLGAELERSPADDPALRVALLRAIGGREPARLVRRLASLVESEGAMSSRLLAELEPVLPGAYVRGWFVRGFLPAPEAGTVRETKEHFDRAFRRVAERPLVAAEAGYLDLTGITGDPAEAANALVYAQTWIESPDERDVVVTLGTDDGSRVFLNDEMVYENVARRGAHPLEHVATWRLRAGRNHVVFIVENGGGACGLYFRVLDDEIGEEGTNPRRHEATK